MIKHLLTGGWELFPTYAVADLDPSVPIAAEVPGLVHTDLMRCGVLEDPFVGTREQDQFWVGKTDWTYRRTFSVGAELTGQDVVTLRFESVDTFSEIFLNGESLGFTDNMFRPYEFDVRNLLKSDENVLEVRFRNPFDAVEPLVAQRDLTITGIGTHRLERSNYARKCQASYGWDWGPMVPSMGMVGEVALIGWSSARIDECSVSQKHRAGAVDLTVRASVEKAGNALPAGLRIRVSVGFDGEIIAVGDAPVSKGIATVRLSVTDPKLWWPNGLGDQPLYEVRAEAARSSGGNGEATVIDSWIRRIGLRTLVLDRSRDADGERFQFVANGVPFFAKGANWIPSDAFYTRVDREQYTHLLTSAFDANMNMLRVWGGGIYEPDIFYDLCDELGICVWHDFMFACSAYPAFDRTYMASVEAEATYQVKRLRHHPSMALWCGNNELEMIGGFINRDGSEGAMSRTEYRELFDRLLPQVVRAHDPSTTYWPSSPHTPGRNRKDSNDPNSGDAHLWSVWHGRKPFEWYRTCTHRFNSEFGFQSFPEPATLRDVVEQDQMNVTSYVMEYRQRSGIGNDAIMQYMLSWFRLPGTFEMQVFVSQILQANAMKYAVEHWRRSIPRGMGTLYWQLNDTWQAPSWSSVDYYGRWKALQFEARRFFAPLMVSVVEDPAQRTFAVHVTNDRREAFDGTAVWTVTDTEGEVLADGTIPVVAQPGASAEVGVVALCDLGDDSDAGRAVRARIAARSSREIVFWVEVCDRSGGGVSSNVAFLVRPKHLSIDRPQYTTRVVATGNKHIDIEIAVDRVALWTWLTVAGVTPVVSDSFVHIRPGKPATLTIDAGESTAEEIEGAIEIRSIADTY